MYSCTTFLCRHSTKCRQRRLTTRKTSRRRHNPAKSKNETTTGPTEQRMDPERVHSYLQVACAGLGFDIGEVWWTSNQSGASAVAAIGTFRRSYPPMVNLPIRERKKNPISRHTTFVWFWTLLGVRYDVC